MSLQQKVDKLASLSAPAGIPEWQWLDYQVQLVLLLAGHKRAVAVGFEETEGREWLRCELERIGLLCSSPAEQINAHWHLFVAISAGDLKALQRSLVSKTPVASRAHGELSGFPPSAIDAYIKGESVSVDAIPRSVRGAPSYIFGTFRYSAQWEKELSVGEEWARTICTLAPGLYGKFLRVFRSVRLGD